MPCAVPWKWGLLKLRVEIPFKTGQKTLRRRRRILGGAACCPTDFRKADEVIFTPQVGTKQAIKSLEAATPLAGHCLVAEQDIDQQRTPHLPKDRVFAVAEETTQLKRLLDLFEKRFDRPSTFVQIGDTRWCPGRVVGDEGHLARLAIDFDDSANQTEHFAIVFFCFLACKNDQIILQNVAAPLLDVAMLHAIVHIVLRAGNPKDATAC